MTTITMTRTLYGIQPSDFGPLVALAALLAVAAMLIPTLAPIIERNVGRTRQRNAGRRGVCRGLRGVAHEAAYGVTRDGTRRMRDGFSPDSSPLPRIGVDATIAAIIARVKSGGDAVEAFEEQGGIRFATPRVTVARAATVLRRRAKDDESEADVAAAARHLAAACRLSERTGCELSRCLEAVADDQRRVRRAAELRRQTFAMPKATIRLLSALPLVTVALGELLGARPVAFLFGSPQGLSCLGLGGLWYACGMMWTRRLLTTFDDAGLPTGTGTKPSATSGAASGTADPFVDLPITLAMLRAALGQGASIPGALIAVGEALDEPESDKAGLDGSIHHRPGVDGPAPAHDGPNRSGKPERKSHAAPRIGMRGNRPAWNLCTCLRAAGYALTRGATWHEAWIGAGAGGKTLESIRECLGEAWTHGVSPTARLELAIERYGQDETAAIERAAAGLSVRLLAPTGLCFLPSFVLIGVIPAIISFVM